MNECLSSHILVAVNPFSTPEISAIIEVQVHIKFVVSIHYFACSPEVADFNWEFMCFQYYYVYTTFGVISHTQLGSSMETCQMAIFCPNKI